MEEKAGCPPESVYYVTILFSVIAGTVRFFFARAQIGFSARRYLRNVIFRIAVMLVAAVPLPLFLRIEVFPEDSLLSFLVICTVSVVCTALAAWAAVLDRAERTATKKMLKDWLRKAFRRGVKRENTAGHGQNM